LEGFVYAVSPFNFTAIAGNLCASAAMMGNTVVWKPSDHQIFSAQVLMELFKEAGLPDGVINMVFGDPEMITNKVLESHDFAGIHYTGSTEVFRGIWGKIIHRGAFDRLTNAIEQVRKDSEAEIIAGGNYDDSVGYFIQPTVVRTTNPQYTTMTKELFGPLVTLYVYPDKEWTKTLKLVDGTSEYALTGAVYSQDRYALEEALNTLENAAGNFYINDKPTGAVVGQQPFGGARGSGTNDKAGSASNLLRWVSPRLIKETFVPAKDYRYPFLGK
jgi:1-pyrroline-5-carboxylate dehydrogenase